MGSRDRDLTLRRYNRRWRRKASGVVAGAAVGQNVVYSVNGGYDQLSGRGALQESFSTGGNDKSSPKK